MKLCTHLIAANESLLDVWKDHEKLFACRIYDLVEIFRGLTNCSDLLNSLAFSYLFIFLNKQNRNMTHEPSNPNVYEILNKPDASGGSNGVSSAVLAETCSIGLFFQFSQSVLIIF